MGGLRLGQRLHHLMARVRLRQQPGSSGVEKFTAEPQLVFAMAVGQKAVMANTLESGRQDVDEKTPLEFVGV